jgi:ferredoxin
MRTEFARSCPVSIFIAGDAAQALETCRDYCDDVGYCVTVTPTTYVYRDGQEAGVVVGLINYPRFPADLVHIEEKAIDLGMRLRDDLGQESFSVQTPATTTWFSWRAADQEIAA